MGILKEFREFAIKGNMIDMAVGIIIGAAFGTLVSSFVGDLIKPPLDYLVARAQPDPAGLKLKVGEVAVQPGADGKAKDPVRFFIEYGKFIQAVISFLITAWAVFIIVKAINSVKKRFEAEKPAPPTPGPTKDQELLMQIRDLLKERAR